MGAPDMTNLAKGFGGSRVAKNVCIRHVVGLPTDASNDEYGGAKDTAEVC